MLKQHFEVFVLREARWVLENVQRDEATAVAAAEALLTRTQGEAVRVVRTKRGISGREYTEEVFNKAAERQAQPVNHPGEVDAAPPCRSLDDLLGLPARLAANRVLRRYLDHNKLTALELAYSPRNLRRLSQADSLQLAAVGRVAAVQAGDGDDDVKARVARLDALILDLTKRAEAIETYSLKGRLDGPIDTWPDQVAKAGIAPDLAAAAFEASLAQTLIDAGHHLAQLEWLMAQLEATQHKAATRALDRFLADILTSSGVVRELMGDQESTGAALDVLIGLTRGRMQDGAPDPTGALSKLAAFITKGRLPETVQVLLDRVRRSIASVGALSREGNELDALRRITVRLMTPTHLLGGPGMAVAITERYARVRGIGGSKANVRALVGIGALFASDWDELLFTVAVVQSTLLRDHEVQIYGQLSKSVSEIVGVKHLLRHIPDAKQRLVLLMQLGETLKRLSLPSPHREQVFERLSKLLAEAQGQLTAAPPAAAKARAATH